MLDGKVILVIEDEKDTLDSYKFKFSTRPELKNIKVNFATNLLEARTQIEKLSPEVVFLDLSLGESAIPEGIFLLKEYGTKYNFVVVSGYKDQMTSCLSLGAKGFVAKPFEFMKMIEEGEKIFKSNASA